jgi:hypothetical protein
MEATNNTPSRSYIPWLIAIGVVGLGWLAYKAANAIGVTVGRFSYSLANEGGQENVLISVPLHITNRGGIDLNVDSFGGWLMYGKTTLGPIIYAPAPGEGVLVSGKTTTITPVVHLPIGTAITNVISLISSGQYFGKLRITGLLQAEGIGINIDQNIQLA